MPPSSKPFALANPKRFKTIQDLTKLRPDCGASIEDIFVIDNESLFIVDLAHLGDLMNPYNNPSASHVRTHGVIVSSYSRSEPCPVLRGDSFLLLPLSHQLKEDFETCADAGKVVGSISCLAGAYLFLPVQIDMPAPLSRVMDEALLKETGLKIKLLNGTYRVFYEQFEAPEGSKKEHYQNIVAQKQ
jgi:hypothetical protein